MMKKIFSTLGPIVLAFAAVVLIISSEVSAQSALQDGVAAAQGTGVPGNLFGDTGIISTITNFLLFIAGALAVIMLIFGGIRYTTSGGNASSVTAAKNTILYAIVGLIIAFLAFAIINFILSTITSGSGVGGAGFTNL